MSEKDLMDKIVSLCKRRGFVFPGSEIYGGLANSWDYGDLGARLKNNLKDWWWKRFVESRDDMLVLDAAIFMNPKVWEASGHVGNFTDPLIECKKCHHRFRPDQISGYEQSKARPKVGETVSFTFSADSKCPNCDAPAGQYLDPFGVKQFNLMFKTSIGTTQETSSDVYLRPELAQAMFINLKNFLDTSRKRLPFGIASVGKVFRNEITPGNFIFRTLEFDLMEFEYFIRPAEWEEKFEYWLNEQKVWLRELGFADDHLRVREHNPEERAHYSSRTVDIEYKTSFGWKEMFGLAYRGDYDLKKHTEKSGQSLEYTDPDTNEKFLPHVIEPTFGLTRLLLMTLLESYREEEDRVYLKLHPKLAPYKVAVFPLLKNKPELVAKAREIYNDLRKHFTVAWDDRGNVGKRYYSQDEIGTPFCVTVDFETLEDGAVTIRDRDTKQQSRIKVSELVSYISKALVWFPSPFKERD